jgi:hypothetical protein
MAQHIFITYTEITKPMAESMNKNMFVNSIIKVEQSNLTGSDLYNLAKKSTTDFFYVINADRELLFTSFNFSFKPPVWDKEYLHIWNNDLSVRLYNKELVLENPNLYSDDNVAAGNVKLKVISESIFAYPKIDIVFLSYNEAFADYNFGKLKNKFPQAKRVNGVNGIYEAHKVAASKAETDVFYVVDADAEIELLFNFDYYPDAYNINTVHVWNSKNPINDLIYGYGGVKLFPRKMLLEYNGSPIDFTTSVSKHFKVMPEVSNITKFNTDPFSAWRSGFRECAKLASKIITNGVDTETEERLNTWCTKGADREFGEFAIEGAIAGAKFGRAHKDQPDMLGLINDYNWLELKFSS